MENVLICIVSVVGRLSVSVIQLSEEQIINNKLDDMKEIMESIISFQT